MTDEQKISDAAPDNGKFKLPEPVFPTMDMPKSPEVAHKLPDNKAHADCEGQIQQDMETQSSNVPPPPDGKFRIMIGIPMLAITYEFMESFLRFWTELRTVPDARYEVGYHFAYRRPVHMAEEYLIDVARFNKCTHILFMDDDIYDITKADLDKLIEADKDVIGGVMYASKFPHAMCVFRRFIPERKVIDMPADNSMYRLYEVPCVCKTCQLPLSHWDIAHCPKCGTAQNQIIQQADLIPFAFTLMKLSVFDKIKKPWFHCTTKYPTDSWFADRLIEAGMTEYGHMGVRLNHAGINDQTRPYFMQMGMAKAQHAKGIVHLTPEDMDRHQYMLHTKMQEVEFSMKPKPDFLTAGKEPQPETVNRLSEKPFTLVTHGR